MQIQKYSVNQHQISVFLAYVQAGQIAIPEVQSGENAHIDHPIALQTDHPKLLFFQRV